MDQMATPLSGPDVAGAERSLVARSVQPGQLIVHTVEAGRATIDYG